MTKLEKLIHDIDSTKTEYLNKKEVLKRLLEIDKINNIKVIEPTELRKEFENDIQVGDKVRILDGGKHHGIEAIVKSNMPYEAYLVTKDGSKGFWSLKKDLIKL